jgi:hypothetical protein
MGRNDAGHESHKIGPRSDYFGEPPPWYRLALKNVSTGLLVAFARVLGYYEIIGRRDSPVCNLF